MSVKKFTFNYDFNATVVFNVDTNFFTEEKAKETLTFFVWDYDEDNDPVEEVLKKYALECIQISASPSFDAKEKCLHAFKSKEGFYKIDGSDGIVLSRVEPFEFDQESLTVKVEL